MRRFALLTLALALSGCHVSNRSYNRVFDPKTGRQIDQSVVAVTPRATKPDEVDANCTPVPFPKKTGTGTHAAHACMAFLEFDDMGEEWDRGQLPAALALIDRTKALAAQLSKPPIVVVFVHGWKNNARRDDGHRNGNVNGFEGVLDYLAATPYSELPVVGIYVGWRGDLVPKRWPARRQLSYFDRERAAIRTPGASMTRALVALATKSHEGADNAYVMMIGHSFGALVLERALAQSMADYGLRAAGLPGSGTTRDGGWADLVIHVNSAAAATEGKQMLDLLKNRVAFTASGTGGQPVDRPLFVSISSLGDAATRFALAVGHGVSFLAFKGRGSFHNYTKADPPQPNVKSQGAHYMSTLAHMQAVQSHVILEASNCDTLPNQPTPFNRPITLPDGRTYVVCEKPQRWNDTPYWAMQMPASIVRDHSSIFTDRFVGLLELFALSKQELEHPAIRPTLRRY